MDVSASAFLRALTFSCACLALSALLTDMARAESAPPDSVASPLPDTSVANLSDSAKASRPIYEYVAYPTLQLLTWPIEKILAPTVEGLVYPIKPPLRYFLNQNVIDRTIDMLSFGPNKSIMVYPTMSIAPGTSSRTGLTLRHSAIFGRPTERFVGQWIMFVNGDYRLRGYLTAREFGGLPFNWKFSATMNRVKNTSANQPGTDAFWFYSDTSETYYAHVNRSLFERFDGTLSYSLRVNRFGLSPPQKPENAKLISDFFKRDPNDSVGDAGYRGLDAKWLDHAFGFSIGRDTRNNENITLDGGKLQAGATYHLTNAGHDFYSYQVDYSKFFKLGSERYELTREEERQAMKGMSIKSFLQNLEYRKLREQFFSRKVLAMHFYAAQSLELPRNRLPVYGLQTLGNDTPLRGYAGSRFRDYTVAGVSAEYRFPLMRLVDGDIFDEYGVRGRDWSRIDYLDFKNSWGFGIRVRRPDIFLFRCEAGFHGNEGVVVNLTVDAAY